MNLHAWKVSIKALGVLPQPLNNTTLGLEKI